MQYPTLEQVEAADREQICRWWRFLRYPGCDDYGLPLEDFERGLIESIPIITRIAERYKEVGGFNSEISKRIGWDKPI